MFITYPLFKVDEEQRLNCKNNTLLQNMKNKFYHTNFSHLVVDCASILFLGNFERDIGRDDFNKSFILSLFMVSLLQTIIQNTVDDLPCEYGFLTVSFSIGTIEICSNYDLCTLVSLLILIMGITMYSLNNKEYLYVNEFLGFVSGLIICIINTYCNGIFKNL